MNPLPNTVLPFSLLIRVLGTVCLAWCTLTSLRADPDLLKEIERAEAIFIAIYDPQATPAIRVERVFYKGAAPLGDMAIFQGVNTMLDRVRSSTPPPVHGRRDVVFSRMAKGDFPSGARPIALVRDYPISLEKFRVDGKDHTIAELFALLKDRE